MNIQLVLAGSLALLGAAIHGAGGDPLVGGPRTTKAMIHATGFAAVVLGSGAPRDQITPTADWPSRPPSAQPHRR